MWVSALGSSSPPFGGVRVVVGLQENNGATTTKHHNRQTSVVSCSGGGWIGACYCAKGGWLMQHVGVVCVVSGWVVMDPSSYFLLVLSSESSTEQRSVHCYHDRGHDCFNIYDALLLFLVWCCCCCSFCSCCFQFILLLHLRRICVVVNDIWETCDVSIQSDLKLAQQGVLGGVDKVHC